MKNRVLIRTGFLIPPLISIVRPTQAMMYALLQKNRLKNYFTYRVVQIFKNIPDIFIFTNLILRTRSCGIGLFTVILDFSLSIFM